MREIVYQEAASGVFEPVPTRAQKRQAKLKREARAEKIQGALWIVALTLIVLGYAAIFAVDLAAPWIWPVR